MPALSHWDELLLQVLAAPQQKWAVWREQGRAEPAAAFCSLLDKPSSGHGRILAQLSQDTPRETILSFTRICGNVLSASPLQYLFF